MDHIKARTLAILTIVLVVSAFMFAFSSTALAAHKQGHDGGPNRESSEEGQTSSEEDAGDDATSEADETSDGSDSGSDPSWRDWPTSGEGERDAQRDPDSGGSTTTSSTTGAGQGCDGSHGSDTGHGANTDSPDNPYHNTCDGSPSQNGAGSGGGRACAGCVGNADDKSPPGQRPNASDHNKGYECDQNSGISKTNPAHTGCRVPPPPCCQPTCCQPPTPPIREDEVIPKPPVLPGPPDVVLPKPPISPSPPRVVHKVRSEVEAGFVLPRTGGSVVPLGLTGLGLVLSGFVLLARAGGFKRRRTGRK